jgi:Fe-S-cluster-containing dehydrogenase component
VKRRDFIKALGTGAAGLALTGASAGRAKAVPEDATLESEGEELCTLLDLSLCIGCGACVQACKETNAHKFPEPEKPFPKMYPPRVPVPDWSSRRDVDDRLTPYNWLYLDYFEVEHEGKTYNLNVPRRCLHCVNPPCANLCPWGAARKQDNGIVRIDDDICLGGSKCRSVCPWNIPQRQTGVGLYLKLAPSFAGNGVMYKCDRCYDRVAEGKLPACIEVCPMDVQTIGPRSEIVAKAHELAEKTGGYIYGETQNGGTNTIYVSPVPFEKLAETHTPGEGRPHLNEVEDRMSAEDKLAAGLVLAPFAGLAAGVLKAASSLSKGTREEDDEQ